MRILGFSGGLSRPSKTYGLTKAIVDSFAQLQHADADIIDLAQVAAAFGSALSRDQLSPGHEQLLKRIESADVLVVASPVYRAAYPGLFKHVFDLIERDALENKAVILAANGGSAHHALIIESHLRPLFNSLGAFTVPTGIYSQSSDFEGYDLKNAAVFERIGIAINEVFRIQSGIYEPSFAPRHQPLAAAEAVVA